MRFTLLTAALVLVPSIAAAEQPVRPIKASGTAGMFEFVATPANQDDLVYARQVLPPSTGGTSAAIAQSRIVYLNRKGVTLSVGDNDSRANLSSIPQGPVSIPAWNTDTATWASTVSCMRELFSPFDITLVDTDPGNVPHIEAVFGGSPQQLGLPANVGGVSPFASDCSVIENSIVFTFTAVLPNDARLACEVMAQEVAHSYGLDHELLASDPMTYLDYTGNRSFKNQAVSCGEDVTRPCGINGSVCRANQNSVALLTERVGPSSGDNIAPKAGITSPANNAVVPPGFQIRANASDNVSVASAKLFIDDRASGSPISGGGPYVFATPASLADGAHTIRIEVSDGKNIKDTVITVTVLTGAPIPDPNAGPDSGDIVGGCATGGSGGGLTLAALGLVGLVRRRRPR